MYLSRHRVDGGARWALDGLYLPQEFTLERLLGLQGEDVRGFIEGLSVEGEAGGSLLAPVEPRSTRRSTTPSGPSSSSRPSAGGSPGTESPCASARTATGTSPSRSSC
jgi:hypothetical protein